MNHRSRALSRRFQQRNAEGKPAYTRDRSLQTHLTFTFVALTLLLTSLLSAGIIHNVSQRAEEAIGTNLEQVAHEMVGKLDSGMFERYRDIQIAAQLIQLYASSPHAIRSVLESLQETYPHYSWIGLTDAAGRVQVSTGTLLEGQDVSQRDWFQGARDAPFVGDVHTAKLLAKLLPSPGEEPLRFVDVATPIKNPAGGTMHVLGAHLDWRWAEDLERSMLTHKHLEGVDIMVLSQVEKVLLGPQELLGREVKLSAMPRSRNASHGHAVERWADGGTYVQGYARTEGHRTYPGLGWTVLVRQDASVAHAPVRQMQLQLLGLALLAALIVSAVSMRVARQIARPLNALTRAAQALQHTPQLGAHAELKVGGYQEVKALSSTLQSLTASLVSQRNELHDRNEELQLAQLEILRTLARAAEYRDDDTGQHIERVGQQAAALARVLGDPDAGLLRRAAPLHDVGKIGIPDAILLKPGRLTADEFERVKQHTVIGARILEESHFPVLQLAAQIALTHHERWDGSGYPHGLRGEEIPLAGRIVAVVDVFDALTHARSYKPAWTRQAALEEIMRQAGRQFDPAVVQAFLMMLAQEG